MPKILNSKFYILVIILIIAAFLRFYNLTPAIGGLPPGLYPDEAMNGNNALEALSIGNFKVFYPENNGREGLFMNIQAVFLVIFGNQPWALRLPSVIFGILTVLGIYFLAKELFKDRRVALLSSFLLATSFWHINFSRIGFRAIMAPFFIVWGIYFLLLALRQIKEQKSPKFYILNSIFSGIFYGLGFHSYIAYRATPILIFIILLIYWLKVGRETPKDSDVTSESTGQADAKPNAKLTRKKILLVAFLFSLIALIVFAPLGLYFLHNPQDFFGRTTQISIFNSPTPLKDLSMNILKTAGMFNFSGDWNWRHNIAGRPLLFWPVGILFLMGILLGLRMFFEKVSRRLSGHGVPIENRDERSRESSGERLAGVRDRVFRGEYSQAFIVLFSWLIIAGLPVVVSNEGIPHALRSILLIPPVFILAGFGGIWLYQWAMKYEFFTNIRIKRLTNIFVFIFLSLLIFEAYCSYFIVWGQNPNVLDVFSNNYVWAAKGLKELPKELPKYVVVENGGVDVRGIPMPAQTVMFITDTFSPEKQKEKNIYYILPGQINKIPENSYVVVLK